jgi:hypothetical protein
MRRFARLMALTILLGMVGSDALAQVVPGPVAPPINARMRRSYQKLAMNPYAVRRHRRHRHHRNVLPPVNTGAVRPF